MLKCVLIDFDGTLADTERIGFDIAVRVCQKVGIVLAITEKRLFVGIRDSDFYTIFGQRHGLTSDAIANMIQHHAQENLRHTHQGIRLFPGAHQLLAFCKEHNLKVAIVSGGLRNELQVTIEQNNIGSMIDCIVAAEDVTVGKPHPEGYRRALRTLDNVPHEAIGIEDSLAGILALKSAKIYSIGIEHASQSLSLADSICPSLASAQKQIEIMLSTRVLI